MDFETSEPTLQPSMTERAVDTATDASRTVGEVTASLRAAVERLSAVAAEVQSGRVIPALRRTARRAPLTSLFGAFLLGVVVARRR